MKYLLPVATNIFQVQGIYCCLNMQNNYAQQNFIKNFLCFSARHITQANMIIIWGYVPPRLSALLQTYYAYLPAKKFIVHINTCEKLPKTHQILGAHQSTNCHDLNLIMSKKIIKEARQCLRI